MKSQLTIRNFGFDLDLGSEAKPARLITHDLLEGRRSSKLPIKKAIELSIADRFILEQKPLGRELQLLEAESLTSEGNGDFVCRLLPSGQKTRVEVVRHTDPAMHVRRRVRSNALRQLRETYPEALEGFQGYALRLTDCIENALIPSTLPDLARGLLDFSSLAPDLPKHHMRTRVWSHAYGGTLDASIYRVSEPGFQDWRPKPPAMTSTEYNAHLCNTLLGKLGKHYDKPKMDKFELLIWSIEGVIQDRNDIAAEQAIAALTSTRDQPFDLVWFMYPLVGSSHLVQLWP